MGKKKEKRGETKRILGKKKEKRGEPKRIYRSKKDAILGGVCGGLAEYFNLDPVLIRLLWVIGTLLSFGVGIIAYLIALIIIPERK